jgi:hypothetical protein
VFFRHFAAGSTDRARFQWCVDHGFVLPMQTSCDELHRAWNACTHAWMGHVLCRRLYGFRVSACDWDGKKLRRLSVQRRGDREWIDLGVVEEDSQVGERLLRPKDLVTTRVWVGRPLHGD